MKFVIGITVAILSLCAVSCRNSSAIFSGDEVLARVGKKQLSTSDINAVLPKGLTGADSADYVDAYVEKWIIKQLKLQEAELMFSSSAADIDRMVDDYRQSLLIRKIEQYYLDTEMHNDVTDEEIEAYYDSHRGDFRLTKSIVKGRIVGCRRELSPPRTVAASYGFAEEGGEQGFRGVVPQEQHAADDVRRVG